MNDIYHYRPGIDTKERFLATEVFYSSYPNNPFADVMSGERMFETEEFNGNKKLRYCYLEGSTMEYVYTYSLNKQKARFAQVDEVEEYKCPKTGVTRQRFKRVKVQKAGWRVRIYRFQRKHLRSCEKIRNRHGGVRFDVRTYSEYELKKKEELENPSIPPQHTANGWFKASHLKQTLGQIVGTVEQKPTAWLDYPSTKYIEIRIDRRTGDFILKDQNGNCITDPEVIKNIIHGKAKERNHG